MNDNKLAKILGDMAWCKGFVEQAGFQNVADKLQCCISELEKEMSYNM